MPSQDERIHRYELQEIIGRGAMGVVYRALDPVIGRVVALKTITVPTKTPDRVRDDVYERFSREARAAGLLSHPNIVTVYDVGDLGEASGADERASFIAMEFVEGRTLRQMVPYGERLPAETALELAMQVARALDYAHRRGIVHRDVKPANILVRDDGLVKLADFGVARLEVSDLTRTGQSVGSPSYIAPEMLTEQPVDGRADLFSLGVILYEVLTGDKPFRGETLAALYHKILSFNPMAPSRANPEVPAEWDQVILRLLAKQPADRYPSAAHLLEDLRRLERGAPLDSPLPMEPSAALAVDEDDPEPRPLREEPGISERTLTLEPQALGPQFKALLALLTVAAVALGLIVLAAVLRHLPAPPVSAVDALPAPEAPRREARAPSARPAVPQPEKAAPAVTVSPKAAPKPALAPNKAGLTLLLEHNLREGSMELTMDGDPVLAEPVSGERVKLKTRGEFRRRLQVPNGDHVFRITVIDEDGKSWSGITNARLKAGSERTLLVRLGGVVKRSLELTWK